MKEGNSPCVDNLSSGVSVKYNVAVTTIEFAIGAWVDFHPTAVLHAPNLEGMEHAHTKIKNALI